MNVRAKGRGSRYVLPNDMTNIPAAACGRCGGWTKFGGCAQHANSTTKRVLGRTGCSCQVGVNS